LKKPAGWCIQNQFRKNEGVNKDMARPSVVFINRVYPPYRGATGRVLRDLARAFARDGWKVTVVTTGKKNAVDQDGPVRVVRTRSFAADKKSALAYAWTWMKLLVSALRQPRADLVVSMTDPPFLLMAGRIVSAAKGSRHIHWCQDLYPDLLPHVGMKLTPFWMRTLKRMTRKTMKKCDRVIVVGRCMARQLTHTGLDPRKITVIPNWPDLELTGDRVWTRKTSANSNEPAILNKIEAAKPYEHLRKDGSPKFRVLYSGNLGRAHPLQTVLGAAQILHKTNPEIEFVFVGDGPSFERLALARAHRGLDNIRLMPWQPAARLREIMESGDLHLITMKHEVEGMIVPCKLYSALAVARPIILIGPQDCETARVIRDFRAGDVVPQGNARRLAETIRRYRMNSDQWFSAFNGATRAGQVFVPRESFDAWLRRAREVIAPAAPARSEGKAAVSSTPANGSAAVPSPQNKVAA
jgi:glycosyltransferase involved in cell wall biosynthesis